MEHGALEYTHASKYGGEAKPEFHDIVRNSIHAGDMLAEPSIWCQWQHVGDFHTVKPALLFEIEIVLFFDLISFYPRVKKWGSAHGARFVDHLRLHWQCISDLFDSRALLQMHSEVSTLSKLSSA